MGIEGVGEEIGRYIRVEYRSRIQGDMRVGWEGMGEGREGNE